MLASLSAQGSYKDYAYNSKGVILVIFAVVNWAATAMKTHKQIWDFNGIRSHDLIDTGIALVNESGSRFRNQILFFLGIRYPGPRGFLSFFFYSEKVLSKSQSARYYQSEPEDDLRRQLLKIFTKPRLHEILLNLWHVHTVYTWVFFSSLIKILIRKRGLVVKLACPTKHAKGIWNENRTHCYHRFSFSPPRSATRFRRLARQNKTSLGPG